MTSSNLLLICVLLGLFSLSTATMRFNTYGEFTILQFTDLHFCETDDFDLKSQQLQRNMLHWVKPDLVVISGDGASGYGPGSMEPGWFKKCWERFTAPIVEYQIPYVYTLGNHDAEGELNRTQITNLDATSPLSLRSKSEGIPNTTNFYVPIYSSRNATELAANIWVFDSGSEGCMGAHNESWGCVEPYVLDWYDQTSQKIKERHGTNVHHVAYYHIPIPEYTNLYNQYPTYGVQGDGVGCPDVNTGLFDHMKKNGDITATFVGHDHNNDYGGWMDRIELIYGRKSGYGGYGDIRGARVLVFNENINEQGKLNVTRVSYVIYENGTLEFDANAVLHNNTINGCSSPGYHAAPQTQKITY